jgi:phenylalanyl-tRNA synthetase alpha chain
MKVSKEEKIILDYLKEKKEEYIDNLIYTGLNKGQIERICQELLAKKLISIEVAERKKFELSEEGKEYLEKGLPERIVLNLIFSGVNDVGNLSLKYEKANIGIIWLKNKGLIKIIRGSIEVEKDAEKYLNEKFPEEILLEKIRLGIYEENLNEEEKDILENLLKRKLVVEKIEKIRKVKITEIGLKEELEIEEEITQLTPEILFKKEWKYKKLKEYELIDAGKKYVAKEHFYNRIIKEVREFLISLGFREFKGPIVEINFWNCDALFMPSFHPARDIHDIFYVETEKKGKVEKEIFEKVKNEHLKYWKEFDEELSKQIILRSQNTAISARVLYLISKGKIKIPLKMFAIDRVFRPDTIDAKHFIEFDQLEGIVVDEDLSFVNLLGYLKELVKIFGAKEVKFKPAYFPFTEPSVEVYVKIKNSYVEIGGAGIFREEVTRPFGIDFPVLAWGMGIGRLAMLKTNVNDIRDLMSQNIEFLRNK